MVTISIFTTLYRFTLFYIFTSSEWLFLFFAKNKFRTNLKFLYWATTNSRIGVVVQFIIIWNIVLFSLYYCYYCYQNRQMDQSWFVVLTLWQYGFHFPRIFRCKLKKKRRRLLIYACDFYKVHVLRFEVLKHIYINLKTIMNYNNRYLFESIYVCSSEKRRG